MNERICRNCPKCHGLWCDKHGKHVNPRDEWCAERTSDFDAWILEK